MKIILDQLIAIIKDVLDDDQLIINVSTSAVDIDGWDSLMQIRIIVAIEKKFKINFSASEVSNLENVGDMAQLIFRKKSI